MPPAVSRRRASRVERTRAGIDPVHAGVALLLTGMPSDRALAGWNPYQHMELHGVINGSRTPVEYIAGYLANWGQPGEDPERNRQQ